MTGHGLLFAAYLLQISTPMVPSQVLGFRVGQHLARWVTRAFHGLAQDHGSATDSSLLLSMAEDHSCMCTQCYTNCCVVTMGHRVTSCEVLLLKLQLQGSCDLQLEPEKILGSHSRHFHSLFLLRNMYNNRFRVKKPTLLAWTNSYPFVRACWEN